VTLDVGIWSGHGRLLSGQLAVTITGLSVALGSLTLSVFPGGGILIGNKPAADFRPTNQGGESGFRRDGLKRGASGSLSSHRSCWLC
jgi:hypothetical protein